MSNRRRPPNDLLIEAIAFERPLEHITKLILESRNLNTPVKERTPVGEAIITGNLQVLAILVQLGANIPQNSLHLAISYNKLDIAGFLIQNGVDVNNHNNPENTYPIHFCTSPEAVRFLLENGADLNAKDVYNRTILQVGNETVKTYVEYIISNYYRNTLLSSNTTSADGTPIFGMDISEKIGRLAAKSMRRAGFGYK